MQIDAQKLTVRRNDGASRFEIEVDGVLAELVFRRSPGVIELVHTGVPAALEGNGIAARLAVAALEYAKGQGLHVIPSCPYVKGYIERHPEWQALVQT